MTQQELRTAVSAASPVASADGSATLTADALVKPATSLKAQIDDAMQRLLGVSAKFRDLTGQDRAVSTREETIAMMHHYMDRLAMKEAVRGLSVIHVAGTKGKGSTCAMTERILREAGYKTGLFTSPHLISPCERFRINGKPVPEATFLKHFYDVWDGLERTADQSGEYPPMAWFFRFLTLLALHIFVEERVDVVILEVGIGGRLDATNVIEKPVVCGITTLDLDHVRVLGETLDKIAYAKAGIFKHGVPAFTTAQEPLAMDMLRQCAAETENPLTQAPVLDQIGPHGPSYELGMQGAYQRVNAGLAVALATTWLQHKRGEASAGQVDFSKPIEAAVEQGLKHAFWPARSHIMDDRAHQTRFYIDGAHTLRSLEVCSEWYGATARPGSKRALIFTIHHERNVAGIIAPLLTHRFDRVYFCPTGASRPSIVKIHSFSEALECADLRHIVEKYTAAELQELDAVVDGQPQWQTTLARLWTALKTHVMGENASTSTVTVRNSVVDCIADLRRVEGNETQDQDETWSVLVTGSLYLAGETLEFLKWSE
ncbi:hypothetical protein Poli38472_006929 [Pythium oligandrum]|uniref:tetrahydrofolate synthase n=1 Tax=Pythium oligandrum TaxID=41045 RepID=A0A8K1FFA2_PYTOL|nr:hypothetical protein Poli38472_006929 [Pythium oligandrum]|eukprot:TMW58784.1 hypothetical protein Poli38472_006929 [Pythium oligandrum]